MRESMRCQSGCLSHQDETAAKGFPEVPRSEQKAVFEFFYFLI